MSVYFSASYIDQSVHFKLTSDVMENYWCIRWWQFIQTRRFELVQIILEFILILHNVMNIS